MRSDGPLKIRKILLEANPEGALPLRLTKESKRLIGSLIQSSRRDQFEIIVATILTTTSIQQLFLKRRPVIVHFSGHEAGTDGIVREDESSEIKIILVGECQLSNQQVCVKI
jgi:hypothetical protein